MKRLRELILTLIMFTALSLHAQVQTDTSKHPPTTPPPTAALAEKPTHLPGVKERAEVLLVVVVLFGGLGLLLNLKRKAADEDAKL